MSTTVSSTGSSFWDLFSAGYEPGSIQRSLQSGLFTPRDSYSAVSSLKLPSDRGGSFLSPNVSIPSSGLSRKPLSEVLDSIDPDQFQIEYPVIRTGSSVTARRSRVPLAAGLVVAVLAGWLMFKNRKAKGAPPFAIQPK